MIQKTNKHPQCDMVADGIDAMVTHLANQGRFGVLSRIESLILNMMSSNGEKESYIREMSRVISERQFDLSKEQI